MSINYVFIGSSNSFLGPRQCLSQCWLIVNWSPRVLFKSLLWLAAKKPQKPALRPLCRGIHWWPVDSPNKGTARWKMFPFDASYWDQEGLSVSGISSPMPDPNPTELFRIKSIAWTRQPIAMIRTNSAHMTQMPDAGLVNSWFWR